MGAHPALRNPALFLALLSALLLLGELSCGGGPGGITRAPAPSDVSATPEQAPAALTDSGLAAAQRHIAQREYRASENGEGLQAPNRVHNLRTYFEPAGIRVQDRTRAGNPELLALRLTGVGRGETLLRVGPGDVSTEGARVEIKRPGLFEWYENSPAGLEQGFTLKERPAGEGQLRLELAVARGEAALHGDAVVFKTATGRRLRYSKLAAEDANGRPLLARLEVPAPDRLQLWVDETDAAYPLTIDPILTAVVDVLLESNQANANFGSAVSGAGDVNGDGFDDVIVGAYRYDAGQTDEGAAFVFLGSNTGIVDTNPATAHAQLESNHVLSNFGLSVSGAGDVNGDGFDDVIIGAHLYETGEGFGEGAAFVFLGSATGIADGSPSTAHAQIDSDQYFAYLGISVSGAGDVNGDGFDDVIVGAERYDAGQTDEGAAFVFLGSNTGIVGTNPATAHAQLESNQGTVSSPPFPANLGGSVSDAGDVNGDGFADVIVGAYQYDAGEGIEGAAFVFLGSSAGIVGTNPATAHAQLESNQGGANFGSSVSGAGDFNGDGFADVIVGAYRYDAEGAAFVFLGSAAGIADGNPSTAHAQFESNQGYAHLGWSVSGAGDVNGDGFDDVIGGAPSYVGVGDAMYAGTAFVLLGTPVGIPNGNPSTPHVQIESNQDGAQLGWSVSGAGDVNGDGLADVIVGARGYNAGESREGVALVFLPEPTATVSLVSGVALLGWLHRRRQNPM
jgi:hypothetical protein